MAYNSLSARRLPANDPFFDSNPANIPAETEVSQLYGPYQSGPEAHQETISAFSGGYFPLVQGNLQHQRGWSLASPPIAASYFPQTHANQREWGLVASPTVGSDLPQTPTNQQESNLGNSPTPGRQISSSQPKSVKHLTCWYWANEGCRLPDHVCLYSHFETGRVANPPVQVQRGRPAVAGKNATNPQPVYKDWKGHHRVHSAVVGPRIQKQIEHIYAKAAQPSTPTPVKAEHSKAANLIKEDWFGPDEPAVNFNLPRPDDYFYLPPADSYRNMSIGIGAFSQPFLQQFTPSPRQTGGNYTAPSPAAQYTDGTTHYGMRGSYGGMGGSYGSVGGSYGEMVDNHPSFGPGPHYFDTNNPKNHNTSGQSGGHSSGPTEMQIKDKVITELAGIVEMLEINYGISIDDQTDTFQKFMNFVEEEERETGSAASSNETRVGVSNVPAPSTSAPSYGKPSANHERIIIAMERSLNLVKMEKMVLAESKARKQVVGGHLESIKAVKLLPRGWIER